MSQTFSLRRFGATFLQQKALLALLFMFGIMPFFGTSFYTEYNLLEMLRSASIMEILAFGVTLTIICGGCDLSIGGTLSLAGILAVMLVNAGVPLYAAIPLCVAAGAVIGTVNGFFIVKQHTEPFIITLGMGLLLKGLGLQLTDAHPLACRDESFMELANGKVFGAIPNLVVIMMAVFVLVHYLLRYTQFGRNCYAIGGDYEVAVYSGINAIKTKWLTYILCGALAAFAGVLLSSKLNTGNATYGDTTALLVNCGVVVGGTSFAGGIGGVLQSAVGLLVFSVLENAMNMLNIHPYIQQIVRGAVIVGIIFLDCFGRKRRREAV